MAKKKPLDVGPDSYGENREPEKSIALPAVIVVVLIGAILYYLFFLRAAPQELADEKIEIRVDDRPSFVDGSHLPVLAISSCGSFGIYLDGVEVASGQDSARAQLKLERGQHTVEAKNGKCSSVISFFVQDRECDDGGERICSKNSCIGSQQCSNGAWLPCILPKKICVPGEKVGCSTDGCKFGYTACNECGDAFGPCLPRDDVSGLTCEPGVCS